MQYYDEAMCGWKDELRSFVSDVGQSLAPQVKQYAQTVGRDLATSPQVQATLIQRLKQENVGYKAGKELGCGIAAAIDDNIPQAFWGSDPVLGPCKSPAKSSGGKGKASKPSPYSAFVKNVTGPTLEEAKRVAARIAKPRIEARLKPWFIGLPIAGLLVGAGITYLVMKRRR